MLKKHTLKHRHLLTADGNIRLRYVMIATAFFVAVIWGIVLHDEDNVTQEPLKIADIPAVKVGDKEKSSSVEGFLSFGNVGYDPEQAGNGLRPFYSRIGSRPYFNKPYNWFKTIEVKSGDALGLLFEDTGLKGDDYIAALKALKTEVNPQDIRPGHKLIVSQTRLGTDDTVNSISYVYDSLSSVIVQKDDGEWTALKKEQPLEVKTRAAVTVIENSIYGSLGKAGVPDGIINRMIKAYSWTVDFQRDIWGGEEVELLYETRETADGEYVRSNRLLYANLRLRNKDLPIYLYEKEEGFPNYFEPDGQSIKRALMKTPIDGARLSSGYGMRKHPVLGYNKMHKGLDFAAPTGTPIYAAGDGIVERANRFSSYGNYIRIRHNDTYKTAYAHLNGFAKGIKKGARVKQGQVIGYVGSTGRSTGPHLHYEVHKNGDKVNPHSVDLPLGEQLTRTQLVTFQREIIKRHNQFASITGVRPNQPDVTLPPRKPGELANISNR